MSIENTNRHENCDLDQRPYLTLAIPPDLPDEAVMLVHDLLEFLTYELYEVYGRKIR